MDKVKNRTMKKH